MIYHDYLCTGCGKEFEVRKTAEEYDEQPDERCPECGSPCLERRLAPAAEPQPAWLNA